MNALPRPTLRKAFTLVELLVVMAIIAIIFSIAAPVTFKTIKSVRLSTAGEAALALLATARQEALTTNSACQIRLYRYATPNDPPGAASHIRALQVLRKLREPDLATGATLVQVGTTLDLQEGVVISIDNDLTSLNDGTLIWQTPATSDTFFREGDPSLQFLSFDLHTDGETDLAALGLPSKSWHLTLLQEIDEISMRQGASPPRNFFTIRIDPFSSHATLYRPGG